MQDYFDTEFWDLIYNEYGVTDELDILSEECNTYYYTSTWYNYYYNSGVLWQRIVEVDIDNLKNLHL